MSTDDCYYFLYSICAKKDCKFRHNKKAKETTIVCPLYAKKLVCQNDCPFRHSTYHLKKNRTEIPCYWEQNGQCKKMYCEFKHKDPEKDRWKTHKSIKTLNEIKSEEAKKSQEESFIKDQLRLREAVENERQEMIKRIEYANKLDIRDVFDSKNELSGGNNKFDSSQEIEDYDDFVKSHESMNYISDHPIKNESKGSNLAENGLNENDLKEINDDKIPLSEPSSVKKRKIYESPTSEANKKVHNKTDNEKIPKEKQNEKKDDKNKPKTDDPECKNEMTSNKDLEEIRELEELLKNEGINFEE
ncbi:Zinc finger CCCH domain-containing protein 11A [Dictyocoela roeselum]|nr:Zinc finger CCCH domain-containing protein 11A [Dictyocoela roeselum]